ncbi:hypothetical protein ACIG0C_36685 [Kitasatospora aureofaciens]|nr:hypothetical protein [Kitasatospora aureofaciens]ARF78095.1 hypothetical protein B6264_03435 [Kitasatospora aureofaciens]OEV37770.1 hypothetical protein HS99_0024565 [Kitasatospora aureofaciens]
MLLVDVDGPLNPYAAKPYRRPEGYGTHRLMTPRWRAAERGRLKEWGLPHKAVKPLRVWLNPAHGPALAVLPYDLVWATTWEEEANTFLSPLLGLPELPFIAWPNPRTEPEGGVFWKTPEIVAWAHSRPFAWADDQITDADRAWVRAHYRGPALLHHVDPKTGLTADDFARLTHFATLIA